MANKDMKICLTLLVIREREIEVSEKAIMHLPEWKKIKRQ